MPLTLARYVPFYDGLDKLEYEIRDARITAGDRLIFEQCGVYVPKLWSQNALNIAAQKYLRVVYPHDQSKPGSGTKESSIPKMMARIAGTLRDWGVKDGYFVADSDEADTFYRELQYLLLSQRAAFNSPVFFNLGVTDNPVCSACFIVGVDDNMSSILDLVRTEGTIFKNGAGIGLNGSSLRSRRERLSGGGTASGPVSFMKGLDSMCGVIKAGGTTRRAAVMRILDDTHLDLLDFIWCKAYEERKVKALLAMGFEGSLDRDLTFWQNSNISVRISDAFMQAVLGKGKWLLRGRHNTELVEEHYAPELLSQLAHAAWECGDPGVQFHDTINRMHTCPTLGPQVASNPCGEYLWINYSACNLASLNLLTFYDCETGVFDLEGFQRAVRIMVLAQDLIATNSNYPDPRITESVRRTRTIGLGYSNLGALLLNMRLPYDSPAAREVAAAISAVMTGTAYQMSHELATTLGAYPVWVEHENRMAMLAVLERHEIAAKELAASLGLSRWPDAKKGSLLDLNRPLFVTATEIFTQLVHQLSEGLATGMRNAQVTVLAPTGTIGFVMDCETTGIEPLYMLTTTKTLVGGGTLTVTPASLPRVLRSLNYSAETTEAICAHVAKCGNILTAPGFKVPDAPIFATAVGKNAIAPRGHLKMLAAVQPFISGGISKTVNLPNSASINDVEQCYLDAWRLGLKAVALYRDGSKGLQPLSGADEDAAKTSGFDPQKPLDPKVLAQALQENFSFEQLRKQLGVTETTTEQLHDYTATKWRLPTELYAVRYKFQVGNVEGYLHVGVFPGTNRPGEIFIRLAKVGSTLAGLLDSFAISVSNQLQHGVPLEVLCRQYKHTKFEPCGMTGSKEKELKFADSIIDHIFRWMEQRFIVRRKPVSVPLVQLNIIPEPPTRYVAGMLLMDEPERVVDDRGHVHDASHHDAECRSDADDEQAPAAELHDEMSELDSDSDGDEEFSALRTESTGDICTQCGAMLQVTGTCKTCPNCGDNSGCG